MLYANCARSLSDILDRQTAPDNKPEYDPEAVAAELLESYRQELPKIKQRIEDSKLLRQKMAEARQKRAACQ